MIDGTKKTTTTKKNRLSSYISYLHEPKKCLPIYWLYQPFKNDVWSRSMEYSFWNSITLRIDLKSKQDDTTDCANAPASRDKNRKSFIVFLKCYTIFCSAVQMPWGSITVVILSIWLVVECSGFFWSFSWIQRAIRLYALKLMYVQWYWVHFNWQCVCGKDSNNIVAYFIASNITHEQLFLFLFRRYSD